MQVLNKIFILTILLLIGCASVPQEEVYNYEPSFWGEEEEDNPLYHPEKVKSEKKSWSILEE